MELGLFTRAFQEMEKERAFEKINGIGIRYIEVVANKGSKHIDLNQALEIDYRKNYERLLQRTCLTISALTLHRDSQLVLGPHGEATQHFFRGSSAQQIEYGIQRTMLAADVASAYGIPLVVGYLGCENFSEYYPWPNKNAWAKKQKIAY